MNNNSTPLFVIMSCVTIVLCVIQIVLSNRLAGSGRKVTQVDRKIDVLRRENIALEQKIASASSLVTIETKARELGYTDPEKNQYITIGGLNLPVAFLSP